jgi:hypothetical protein
MKHEADGDLPKDVGCLPLLLVLRIEAAMTMKQKAKEPEEVAVCLPRVAR